MPSVSCAFERVSPRDTVLCGANGVLFVLGWVTLVASLVSPLHELGEISFSAHMTEHELLMLLAAPLMALARPISVFLWACPHRLRRRLVEGCNSRYPSSVWRFITGPAVATLMQICALWVWHMPSLFDRALDNEWWHALQALELPGDRSVVLVVAYAQFSPAESACKPLRSVFSLRRWRQVR